MLKIIFKEYGGNQPVVHDFGPYASIEIGEESLVGVTSDGERKTIVQRVYVEGDPMYWTPDFGPEWVGRFNGQRWLSDPIVLESD